jgi:predicted secreted protein
MSPALAVVAYLTIWWTVLLAILPLGTTSYAEAGEPVPGGGDPSAPINPNLKRKVFTTTWISAIVLGLLWLVLQFHLVRLPSFPGPH